ncbi:MAG: hypothetical protein V3S26_01185 [Acidimicrobiia bacterium]
MTQQDDLNFPWGRWLLWGLLAIVVLVAITLFFINLGDDTEAAAPVGEQVEWSIVASEYTPSPGNVTLKGDIPLGFPTETWKDGNMLARSVGESFEWNMDVSPEVPTPVYEIDEAGSCGVLQGLLDQWATDVAQAAGEARRTEAEAFAQHAVNTMGDQGCQISTG